MAMARSRLHCVPAVCSCCCAENDYRSDAFTSSHIQLLQLLCSQAALSIDNARLYGALREYNASLEQQVHGRTAELEQKNKQLSMAKEVAEAATKAKADFLSNMVRRSFDQPQCAEWTEGQGGEVLRKTARRIDRGQPPDCPSHTPGLAFAFDFHCIPRASSRTKFALR